MRHCITTAETPAAITISSNHRSAGPGVAYPISAAPTRRDALAQHRWVQQLVGAVRMQPLSRVAESFYLSGQLYISASRPITAS